jgi:hypothetical protein
MCPTAPYNSAFSKAPYECFRWKCPVRVPSRKLPMKTPCKSTLWKHPACVPLPNKATYKSVLQNLLIKRHYKWALRALRERQQIKPFNPSYIEGWNTNRNGLYFVSYRPRWPRQVSIFTVQFCNRFQKRTCPMLILLHKSIFCHKLECLSVFVSGNLGKHFCYHQTPDV